MKEIELENVKRWITTSNKMSHPVSINSICPGCHMNVVFATKRRHYDAQRDTLAFSSECPACNLTTHFWMTHMTALTDDSDTEQAGLYMLPASADTRLDLSAISDILPDSTLQYCSSTQDVYQSGNFTATRVMVKSTLDAIFTGFLPPGNSHTTLFKTVQDSMPSMQLDDPLMKLAASLRKGEPLDLLLGNPEPASPETAEALMQLVEKLVNFLYVIPGEFHRLDQQLTELSKHLPPSSRVFHPDEDDREAAQSADTSSADADASDPDAPDQAEEPRAA